MNKKLLVRNKKPVAQKINKKLIPVVTIGASAGGMEAMIEILKHLPPDTGMAYVFIQHLHPTHESMLTEIFSKATKMQVLEAKNLMSISPDTLYIIPPNKDISIVDGVLNLKVRKPKPAHYNEEQEPSKEEVGTTNEELMRINNELQLRNEQLAEAYEYSEVVFGTIREAILVLDKNLRVKSANKAFYKTFITTEEETEGMLIYELSNRSWDIPRLRQLLEEIVFTNNMVSGCEVVQTFGKLGEKVLLLNARQIGAKQQPLILLAIDDITENRRASKIIAEREALFRNMADNAPVMIWIANANRERIFFNRTWLAYSGKNLQDEVSNGWVENIHQDDLNNFLKVYNSSFEDQSTFQIECRIKRNDNTFRWTLCVGKPTYAEDGHFTGLVGTCTEIHDQRIINEELEERVGQRTSDLQESNKELERSNNELQQFAYVASHDLQEPLRKIMSFADRLQKYKPNLPESASQYLEKIATSSDRMRRLIDDLLNFSRITKSADKFVRTNLNEILKVAISDFDLIIKERKASVDFEKLPTIEAIPLQMEQLFHNLLSNALKFGKEGRSLIIEISCEELPKELIPKYNLDDNLKYIRLTFKDNGIGFDARFAEQIFVIFQRLNDKKNYPGTGIGLALCRKIVHNHNGEIYATSENGSGASFCVVLPVTQTSK